MDKSIIRVFKMSFTLRKLIHFRRGLTGHNFQTSLSFSSSKDTESKSICDDLGDNPSAIFNYVHKNQDSLSGKNCIEALQKLSQCYSKSSCQSNKLRDKKDLLVLCSELDKRTKTLESSQAVEAIQLLSELGISPKSIIIQSLLKNIQTNLHSLTVEDVNNLNKIFNEINKSDMTHVMRNALSVISQSKQEITDPDIISLCGQLYQATHGKYIDRNTITSILNRISTYSSKIPALTAKSIFVSSSYISDIMLPQFPDLLRKIQQILVNEAHTFEYQSVVQILDAMINAQQDNNVGEEFYNEQLIDSMINQLLSRNCLKIEEGNNLLVKLRFLGHFQKSLIDYIAYKYFETPTVFLTMKSMQLLQFVSGLTVSTYKPPFWESIHQLIEDNENLKSCTEYTLIRILCNLAIMDSFPHNLISKVFQLKKERFNEIKFTTVNRLGLLYQLVKTLDSNYTGPWPSESVLHSIHNNMNSQHPLRIQTYPLLPALEKALGGSEYIKTRVRTKLGHFIDHVIIMRKGAFPVAINQERSKNDSNYENKIPFIEDIIVPPESQVIAISSLTSGAYLRNLKQPRGHLQAWIRSLEALKYIVIPVYLPEWINLNERDKIPYIMNQIRLKCPADNISVNI